MVILWKDFLNCILFDFCSKSQLFLFFTKEIFLCNSFNRNSVLKNYKFTVAQIENFLSIEIFLIEN